MPIIEHGVQAALRQAGIIKDESELPTDLTSRLERKNLDLDSTLLHLHDIVNGADTSAVKLRAVDTILKLHGVLKDQAAPPPSVTFVIQGGEVNNQGLNPILIPRKAAIQ